MADRCCALNTSVTNCHLSNLVTGNSEALTLVGNVDSFLIDRDTVTNTKNIGIVAAGHYSWAVDPGVPASLSQSRNGTISHCLVFNNRRFSNVDARQVFAWMEAATSRCLIIGFIKMETDSVSAAKMGAHPRLLMSASTTTWSLIMTTMALFLAPMQAR
ncbi:MAG: hypothetical protein IPH36_18250 [Saprospiraceae bacterium]|nr:hypothetical protein [Saprospiraceae bacterium]